MIGIKKRRNEIPRLMKCCVSLNIICKIEQIKPTPSVNMISGKRYIGNKKIIYEGSRKYNRKTIKINNNLMQKSMITCPMVEKIIELLEKFILPIKSPINVKLIITFIKPFEKIFQIDTPSKPKIGYGTPN